MDNKDKLIPGGNGLTFAGAGAAVGTAFAAVAGTALAAPAAIGLGVGLMVWGIKSLVTEEGKK